MVYFVLEPEHLYLEFSQAAKESAALLRLKKHIHQALLKALEKVELVKGAVAEAAAAAVKIKEALIKSARAICETILRQKKAQNRRNTVCISSFCNDFMA